MQVLNTFIPKFNISNNRGVNPYNKAQYPNLAPLKCDTVSFKRSEKAANDSDIFGISIEDATTIHEEAHNAKNYLEMQLTKILGDMVAPKDILDIDKPIYNIEYRIKKPESIQEKSKTRRFINPKEVKSGLTDIIGARIIMNDSRSVDKVLKRLTTAERNNDIQIIEIENYRPEPEIDEEGNITQSYDYASPQALRKLKSECDKKGVIIPKRDEDAPTGYMAIHLLTKLPNGFTGEIQIIGKDVAELKCIEDLCYKIKNGKKIPDVYEPLREQLEPLTDKEDTLLQREYNNYTRAAYIYQRMKEPLVGFAKPLGFLKIPNYLPDQLDFNNIAKTKSKLDNTN